MVLLGSVRVDYLRFVGRRSGPERVGTPPVGPLVEELGQPVPRAPRGRGNRVRIVRDEIVERGPPDAAEVGDRLARGATTGGDRLPDPDPETPPEGEPARAVDGDRDERHARPDREERRALVEGQQRTLTGVDP